VLAVGTVLALSGGRSATAAADATRPSLSPIEATFSTVLRRTDYEVHVSDPEPGPTEWDWTLEPPADDPGCKRSSANLSGRTVSTLIWYHADEDGCSHIGTDHAGRITVHAKTGDYECTATITGSSTHSGPEPDPCFKRPAVLPPPASNAPPAIVNPEKAEWKDTAAVVFGGSAAFSGLAIACALVPSPDPVSKGLAVVMLLISVGHMAYGQYALSKASDPPDKNYKQLAKLGVPKLPAIRPGNGVTLAEAEAANAILANVARVSANDAAFITSFERAQGAYAARDGTWDRRQSRATAKYARAEAKLLDAQPALDVALKRAVAQANVPPLTAADAKRATASVVRNGLPASFTSPAARLGITKAEIRAHEKRVAALPGRAIAGLVAAKLATPATARAHRTAAKLLRALAGRLAKR
jgi:hypothetical protein